MFRSEKKIVSIPPRLFQGWSSAQRRILPPTQSKHPGAARDFNYR